MHYCDIISQGSHYSYHLDLMCRFGQNTPQKRGCVTSSVRAQRCIQDGMFAGVCVAGLGVFMALCSATGSSGFRDALKLA